MCSREDPRFVREDVLLVCTVLIQRPDSGFVAEKLLNMKLGNTNHNRQLSLMSLSIISSLYGYFVPSSFLCVGFSCFTSVY